MIGITLGEGDIVSVRLYDTIDNQRTPFRIKVQDGKIFLSFGTSGDLIPLDEIHKQKYDLAIKRS